MLRRWTRSAVALTALVVAGLSCGERITAPQGQRDVAFAVAPAFTPRAALIEDALATFGLSVDTIHIVLTRAGGEQALDTLIAFPAAVDSVAITLRLPISGNSEAFTALIELRQGSTVLFSGTQGITLRVNPPSGGNAPTIPIEYVGPGAEAETIVVFPADTVVLPAAAFSMRAVALDGLGDTVTNSPIDWRSLDPTIGTIDGTGNFTAVALRGIARIAVKLPNLVEDTALVRIVPPATHMAVLSGGGQTGAAGAALSAPIVVQVQAADNLPVPGATVNFAVDVGGGSVAPPTALGDTLGRVNAFFTLGTGVGVQSIRATSAGLPDLVISATSVAGAVSQIVILDQPQDSATVGVGLDVAPRVELRDAFGNPRLVAGTNVTVALTAPAVGSISGPTTVPTDANGQVAFAAIQVNALVGPVTLTFTSGALPAVVSDTVILARGPAALLTVEGGTGFNAPAGDSIPLVHAVRVTDAGTNPVDSFPLLLERDDAPDSTVVTDSTGRFHLRALGIPQDVGVYPLTFSGTGLTGPVTITVTVTPGAAAAMAFAQLPSDTAVIGNALLQQPHIQLKDAFGNAVATVGVAIEAEIIGGGQSLTGTEIIATNAAGTAVFTNLAIVGAAGSVQLRFIAAGLDTLVSDTITLFPALATELQFTLEPSSPMANTPFNVIVTATDGFGNTDVGFTGNVTVAMGTNPSGSTLGGTLVQAAVGGVATFGNLTLNNTGTGHRLVATSPGLTPDTTALFDVITGVTYHDVRRPGDIAIYKNVAAWFGENKDETVLQGNPFKLSPALGDYVVHPMADLLAGIPATTSLVILTSASDGDAGGQIDEEQAGFPNLDTWVRNGGWLVVHAGDNYAPDGYDIPGLTGQVDADTACTGLAPAVSDHAFIRGPDALLGTADDIVPFIMGVCSDNHGSLEGILPGNAEVLLREDGDLMRAVYATYTLGAGRVIVTTQSIEFVSHSTQALINHFYWAINGVNAPPAQPVVRNVNWLGGTGSYNDPAKWDIGMVPAIDDTVRIQGSGIDTVVVDGSVTAQTLIVGGASGSQTLRVTGFLSVTDRLTVNPTTGHLFLDDARIDGTGAIDVNGSFYANYGELHTSGPVTFATASSTLIEGTVTRRFGPWLIDGLTTLQAGHLQFIDGASGTVSATGTLDLVGASGQLSQGGGGGSFVNNGLIHRYGGGGQYTVSVPFTNNGTVTIDTGTVRLDPTGTFTHNGTWNLGTGGVFDIANGNNTLNGNVTGSGAMRFISTNVTLAGTTSLRRLAVNSGTVNATGDLALSDTLLMLNGTLNLNTGGVVTTPRFQFDAGTVGGTDTLVVTDSLIWSNGTMTGLGRTVLAAGADARATTTSTKIVSGGRSLHIGGSWRWDGGTMQIASAATITVLPTGVFDIAADLGLTLATSGSLLNQGIVRKSAGVGIASISVPFTNEALTETLSGTLRINAGGTYAHPGAFVAGAGSVLDFQSNVVTFDSTLSGAGVTRFSGSTVTANGSISTAGLLVTSGAATLTAPLVGVDSLSVTGGTLTLNSASTITVARVSQTGGTLQGTDTLVVSDSLIWTTGTMGGTGVTRIDTGAAALLSTTSGRALSGGRRFETRGTTQWTDGALSVANGSVVEIAAGGTMSLANNVSLTPGTGGGTLQNDGLFQKIGGTGISSVSINLVNTGTLSGQTGTLRFATPAGPFTTNGTITTGTGATVEYTSGTHQINAAVGGTGTFGAGGSVAMTVSGPLAPFHLFQSGGTLTLASNVQHAVPKVSMTAGTLQGNDTLTVTDSLIWSGGTMQGAGRTVVDTGASAYLSTTSGRTLTGGRTFLLRGFLNHENGGFGINAGSVVTVDTTAQYLFTGAVSVTAATGGQFVNNGIVAKPIGTGIVQISAGFTNNGDVAVSAGTLRIGQSSGTFTHTGDFATTAPGILEFNGATQNVQGVIAGTGGYQGANGTINVTGGYFLPSATSTGGVTNFNTGTAVSIPLVTMLNAGFGGTDTLYITDSLHWNAGEMHNAGVTVVVDTAVALLTSANVKTLLSGRTVEIRGTLLHDAGNLLLGGASTFNVAATGNYQMRAGVFVGNTTGNGVFNNAGQLVRNTATGAATMQPTFTNTGSVDVLIGSLAFTQSGTSVHSGGLNVFAPGALSITAGSHTFDGGLTGNGAVTASGGTVVFNQPYPFPVVNATGAAVTFAAGAPALDTMRISSGSLTASGGGLIGVSALLLSGGTLQGTDTVVVADSLDWAGGAMQGTGRTQLDSLAVARLSTTAGKTLGGGRAFDLAGTATWSGGTLQVANGSPLNIEPTGELLITANLVLNNSAGGIVNNLGAVRRTGGTGTTTISAPFENDGLVELTTGLTAFTSSATHTHSGAWVVNGATLEFGGGTHVIDSSIVGTGGARFNATSVTVNGSFAMPWLNMISGATTIVGGVTPLDTLRMSAGTLSLSTGGEVEARRYFMASGILQGADTLVVTDSLEWGNGTMQGTGRTVTLDTTQVHLMSTSTKTLGGGRALDIAGPTIWSGGSVTLAGGSPITFAPTADVTVTANVVLGGTGTVVNNGVYRRTTATGTHTISVPFRNQGQLEVHSGVVALTGSPPNHAGTFLVMAPAVLEFGGTQTIDSTITGTGGVRFNSSAVTVQGSIGVTHISNTAGIATLNGPIGDLDSLRISAGALNLSGDGSVNTRLAVLSNGTRGGSDSLFVSDSLAWAGGTFSDVAVTSVADTAGTSFTTTGKSLSVGHKLLIGGPALWNGGNITLNDSTELHIAPTGVMTGTGSPTMSGTGKFIVAGAFNRTTTATTLSLNSALINSGSISTTAGVLSIGSPTGTQVHSGTWTAGAGASLTFAGAATNQIDSTISGAGSATFAGGTTILNGTYSAPDLHYTGGFLTINGPLLVTDTLRHNATTNSLTLNTNATIPSTGTWTLVSSGGITGTGSILNQGSFVRTANSSSIAVAVPFVNEGSFHHTNGILTMPRQFTHQAGAVISGNATIAFTPDSLVAWDGTIGPRTNTGTLSGQLTINGLDTLPATAVIEIEIGGTAIGTQFDRLNLGSQTKLEGILNVSIINGYVPAGPSITFDVIQLPAGTPTPTFSQFNAPPGWTWSVFGNFVRLTSPP